MTANFSAPSRVRRAILICASLILLSLVLHLLAGPLAHAAEPFAAHLDRTAEHSAAYDLLEDLALLAVAGTPACAALVAVLSGLSLAGPAWSARPPVPPPLCLSPVP